MCIYFKGYQFKSTIENLIQLNGSLNTRRLQDFMELVFALK
jgi:hypothetical protein